MRRINKNKKKSSSIHATEDFFLFLAYMDLLFLFA